MCTYLDMYLPNYLPTGFPWRRITILFCFISQARTSRTTWTDHVHKTLKNWLKPQTWQFQENGFFGLTESRSNHLNVTAKNTFLNRCLSIQILYQFLEEFQSNSLDLASISLLIFQSHFLTMLKV